MAAVTAAATTKPRSAPIGLSRSMLPFPTKSLEKGETRRRREGDEKSDTRSRKVRDLLL